MKQDYTFRFLLKYLYGETSLLQKLEIENAIQEDCATASTYVELKEGYDKFPKVSFYPSIDTMSAILNYSKQGQLSPGL